MATQCMMLITLIPLLILSQSFSILADERGEALINSTCKKTEYPEDCISALESDPRSFDSNLTELTRISLEMTFQRANDSYEVAEYWLYNSGTFYPNWTYASCVEYYNYSIYAIKDGLQTFDESKYNKTYQNIESVKNVTSICQSYGLVVLNDVNAKMLRIVKVVLDILHMLF